MVFRNWTENRPVDGKRIKTFLFWRSTVPTVVLGVLLLSVGIVSAWRVHQLHQRGDRIVSENVSSIREAKELETLFHRFRYRLKRFLRGNNERHLEEIAPLIPECRERLSNSIEFGTSPEEKAIITRLQTGADRLIADFDRLTQADVEERASIATHIADEIIPNQLLVATREYAELNERKLAESNQRNQTSAVLIMLGLLSLGTLGAVGGLLAGYGISRSVNRTIVQLSIPIQDTAGKLDEVVGPISVSSASEFEDLEEILKTVSSRVSTVVERLQESEREMMRAEQLAAVGQLAAGVAHELRNPLTAVKPILQLSERPQDLTAQDLDVLRVEIDRLEASIQTLLDFARPTAPKKTPTELNGLIQETVQLVSRRAERQSVRIEFNPSQDLLPVLVDLTQMRQVILNLLLNALEAVPGGGCVKVESSVKQPPPEWRDAIQGVENLSGSWALVRVHDSGHGISHDVLNRLFDPFVSTKETGTGLGLSICKRVLEAHDGIIIAENETRGGAVISFWIQLIDEQNHFNRIQSVDHSRNLSHAERVARG